jgi:5'-deoxynucleotidase YfbR-like HD superfamily hydrolase
MHDSTEAYLGDLVLPVKRSFPEFEKAERALWKVIAEVFDLDPAPFHPSIKEADIRVLATEARDLFGEPTSWMGELRAEPYDLSGLEFGDKIRPWNWLVAKERFLGRFSSLAEKRRTSNGRE